MGEEWLRGLYLVPYTYFINVFTCQGQLEPSQVCETKTAKKPLEPAPNKQTTACSVFGILTTNQSGVPFSNDALVLGNTMHIPALCRENRFLDALVSE